MRFVHPLTSQVQIVPHILRMSHHARQTLGPFACLSRQASIGPLPRRGRYDLISQRARIPFIQRDSRDHPNYRLLVQTVQDCAIQIGYRVNILFDPQNAGNSFRRDHDEPCEISIPSMEAHVSLKTLLPQNRNPAQLLASRNPFRPLRRTRLMHTRPLRIHRHCHRHIHHVELVDRLHAEIPKRQ